MDVAEQPALLGLREPGAPRQLDRAADVVQQRGRQQEIRAEARMELHRLAAERRHADRVLEQPARIAVMAVPTRRR